MSVLSAEPTSPPAMRPEPPASMVERMTLIMDAFAGPHTRLTLEDVTRRTNLPRSTAHRILDQLVRLKWLDRTPLGYGLGQRALELGGKGGSNVEIREAAAPLLQNLYVRTGMVVHLAVLENSDVFYLDKIGGRFALAVPSRVAGRAPAHCTALGKAILAWLQPEQVEVLIGTKINRLTNRSIGDISTLHQELNRIRQRRGLAFERGECFPHLSCVAAAIRGPRGRWRASRWLVRSTRRWSRWPRWWPTRPGRRRWRSSRTWRTVDGRGQSLARRIKPGRLRR